MDIETRLKTAIRDALRAAGITAPESLSAIVLEHPDDPTHGDFATTIALVAAKAARVNPRELAGKLAAALSAAHIESVDRVETAGPGFINFYLTTGYFIRELETIEKRGDLYGNSNEQRGRRVLVEYTDPNPFKEFHIGHLMSNAIGESIARLIASQGAKVRRMCYQGDFGLHVAKTLWAALHREAVATGSIPAKRAPLAERIAFLGSCYAEGSRAYEDDPAAKQAIDELNKKIFDGKDRAVNKLYKLGKKWSLQHFEEIYAKLGTKFDYYVLESEVAHDGIAIVDEFLEKGVFERSDGAVVFHGEKHDPKLHTRVFINSQGIPTYEAKELGLNTKKWKKVHPDESIIITANEQNDYFRVVMKALELILPEAAKATKHISHGMLRFAEGKMSSRTGNVITGESLIADVEKLVQTKLALRDMDDDEKKEAAEIIAVAAIKYSILRQATSSDIVYDFDTSISFEGDSGPYLLYTAVRAQSVLDKAKSEGVKPKIEWKVTDKREIGLLERELVRFPEVVARAASEKAPHHVATYLIGLASLFNGWYARVPIVAADDPGSPYKVALTQAVRIVLANGLKLLGIKVPDRM